MFSALRRGARKDWARRYFATLVKSESELSRVLPMTFQLAQLRKANQYILGTHQVRYNAPEECDKPKNPAARTPSQSWLEIKMPFSTAEILRDNFSLFGTDAIRTGRLLETLDAFAADIAHRHVTLGERRPDVTLTTARLGGLNFVEKISIKNDLILRGAVTWKGTSSMEIQIDMLHIYGGREEDIGKAVFVIVGMDTKTKKPCAVPPLEPFSKFDKAMYEIGTENNKKLKRERAASLKKLPPSGSEMMYVHELYKLSTDPTFTGVGYELMNKTFLSSTEIMQSQDRNINNNIFGGHLMRLALEQAWTCAHFFAGGHPEISTLDDVNFISPVEIGNLCLVAVDAEVINPATGQRQTTNEFHLTFKIPKDPTKPLAKIIPNSYAEVLHMVDGMRSLA